MEENQEEQETPEAEPEQAPEEVDTSIDESTGDNDLVAKVEDLNKKFEDQKKWNEKLQRQIEKGAQEPSKPETEPSQPNNDRLEKLETSFTLYQQGYTQNEVRDIIDYAKGAGITVEEAKNSPFVKSAITAMRKEAESKAKTPNPTGRSVAQGSAELKQVLSNPEATAADRQAAFEKRMRGSRKSAE